MLDGWADCATDYCSHDSGRPTWSRLAIKLFLAYLILAAACWTESRFRKEGIELEARVELVGQGPKGSQLVRYHFRDPMTGTPRMNTVGLPRNQELPKRTALIEYIPGEFPSSRLKIQARPYCINLFVWMNIVFIAAATGFIIYVAREANRPIRRHQ